MAGGFVASRRGRVLARAGACAIVVSAAAACGRGDDVEARYRAVAAGPIKGPPNIPAVVNTSAPAEAYLDPLGQRTAHLTSGQIAGALNVMNQGEIALARLELAQGAADPAKTFARTMVSDHGQALQMVAAAADSAHAQPAPSDAAGHTERSAQQEMAALTPLAGRALDRVYLDTQVRMHQAALDAIDQQLLPDAKDPNLQAVLRQLRGKVEEHLQTAIQVRASLGT